MEKNLNKNISLIKKFKLFIIVIALFLFLYSFININIKIKIIKNPISLAIYKHYIYDCINSRRYNRKIIINKIPFFSICLPVYNMEYYIRKCLISILNQSFQDFEIIILNDFSEDNTENIIKKFQSEDNRIKLVNHKKNLGTYTSRIDAVLFSKGKYIIFVDPDDMILNPKLLKNLYYYNLKYNLDIIEYLALIYNEEKLTINIKNQYLHYHQFSKKIIYQPELSEVYFYLPGTKNYSKVQCRNIWNKTIRRNIILNTINYIGKTYYNQLFNIAEDIGISLIIMEYAQNYSNIYLPGYLYNIRKTSVIHDKYNNENKILFFLGHLLYFKIFYNYIKGFGKDRNFLYYELKSNYKVFLKNKNLVKKFFPELNNFYKEILNDKFISESFKDFLINLTLINKI